MRATICLNRGCVKAGGQLPLLEPDQGKGQDEPVWEIAEVGSDAVEQQVNLLAQSR
jgi:hypothetical protein